MSLVSMCIISLIFTYLQQTIHEMKWTKMKNTAFRRNVRSSDSDTDDLATEQGIKEATPSVFVSQSAACIKQVKILMCLPSNS